ncbi:hypothetical protein KI387_023294, partial [Taxus chinensis]
WVGSDVCGYNDVFCAPALDNPILQVVAGIDMNHAEVAGFLPEELGMLTDLSLIHINTNRFCEILPRNFKNLNLLFQ